MAALTTADVVDAGTAPVAANVSASDTIDIGNGHNVVAHYTNTSVNPLTLTVVVPGTGPYSVAYPDPTFTLIASTGELYIPIRKEADPGDGSNRATITATGTITAGQKVQILRVN